MKITLEHEGVTYEGQVGTVTSTMLGYEGHGLLTTSITIEGKSWGVSLGGMALTEWSEEHSRRVGTAFGLDHIIEILRVFGVERWEDIKGQPVLALYEGHSGPSAIIRGIANIEGDRVFIPAAHAKSWLEKVGA